MRHFCMGWTLAFAAASLVDGFYVSALVDGALFAMAFTCMSK